MNPELSRRSVIKVGVAATAGLILGCRIRESAAATPQGSADPFAPNAWLRIAPSGEVFITVAKPDIGTGVRTSLAMIVAEELGVAWETVKVEQAVADSKYGSMMIGGSASVRSSWRPLREAGAAARAMLIEAAAKKWGVEPGSCRVENGVVLNHGPEKATFGELAAEAAKLPVPTGVALKDPKDFTIIGKRLPRVDNRDVVTGAAKFGMDARIPGMLVAVVARPEAFGGTIASYDEAAARKVPGVRDVIKVSTGIAVLADHTWAAMAGREALAVKQDPGPNAALDSETIHKRLGEAFQPFGDAPEGKVVEAEYEVPYLSHAPMEPMNCTVGIADGKCTIYAPSQAPDAIQRSAAQRLSLDRSAVTVHTTLVGGGFGRRFQMDFANEAVEIAQAAGKPVQVVWSRDDDMKHDFYRPTSRNRLRAVLGADGKPILWQHQFMQAQAGRGAASWGREEIPYRIPTAQRMTGGAGTPIPTGAWRSVSHSNTGFAIESFVDELAYAAGADPLEYRKGLITDPRLLATLERVAKLADWKGPKPAKGKGRGVGCFAGYGSYFSMIVDVTHDPDLGIVLNHVYAVVDCGIAINASGVEAQVIGGVNDGIATAMKSAITIKGGAVEQSSYFDFEWLRMNEAPKFTVEIVASHESPGGMGEVAYPPAPAAVANAIYAATGHRLRTLPMNELPE